MWTFISPTDLDPKEKSNDAHSDAAEPPPGAQLCRRPWGPAGPKRSKEEGTAALGLSDTGQLAPSAFSDRR